MSDDAEIRNLIVRLAMASDEAEPEAYAALFTEDGRWGMKPLPGVPTAFPDGVGRAQIVAGLSQRRAAAAGRGGQRARHVVFMSDVTVRGDSAEARSLFGLYRGVDGTPELAMLGTYEDEFRHTPAGWLCRSRRIAPA